jgi:hypothetical protein
MHASKHLPKSKAVIVAVACLWACGGTVANNGAGGAGGEGGASATPSGGSLADAALGTGGVGLGGGTAADAPVGSGGIAQTGGQPGTGGASVGSGGIAQTGGQPSTGGKTAGSSGGIARTGGQPGTGGKTAGSSGGMAQTGGQPGSGGKTGAGGSNLDGGTPSSGGATGTGGGTGTGGSATIDAGARCGGFAGTPCPTGQYCDIFDHCHKAGADFAGVCVPAGPDVVCPAVNAPVCGCNGKTYPSDCERGAAKVQKFSDGPCVSGRDASAATDEMAYLSWGALPKGAKTGPGVIVSGIGYYAAEPDAPGITAMMDPGGAPTWSLSNDQLDDLFARLATIDFSALPHLTAGPPTCTVTLEVFMCRTCGQKTLTYSSPVQVAPEMEPVWAWFDQLLGSPTVVTNPRTYCSQ